MSRYIDADKLTDRAYQLNFDKKISERELAIVNRLIGGSPTEDVAPVVHAHWVKKEIPVGTMWGVIGFVCSRCIYRFADKYNYCPECGAKMDLGKDEDHAD